MNDVITSLVVLMWIAELFILGHVLGVVGLAKKVRSLEVLDDDEWVPLSDSGLGLPSPFKNKKEELNWRRSVIIDGLDGMKREVYVALAIALIMPFVIVFGLNH